MTTNPDRWLDYDLGSWSREAPTVPGPYYLYDGRAVVGVSMLRTRGRDDMWVIAFQGEPVAGATASRPVESPALAYVLWHPWQAEPPAPPKQREVDPGPGVWMDKPWHVGVHAVWWFNKSAGVAGMWMREDAYVNHGPLDTARVDFFQGPPMRICDFPPGTRWYRYPSPPEDPRVEDTTP